MYNSNEMDVIVHIRRELYTLEDFTTRLFEVHRTRFRLLDELEKHGQERHCYLEVNLTITFLSIGFSDQHLQEIRMKVLFMNVEEHSIMVEFYDSAFWTFYV